MAKQIKAQDDATAQDPQVAAPVPAKPKADASPTDELCAVLGDLVAYATHIGPSTAPAVVAAQAALAKYAK